jgi:hypothetical protein
LTFSEGRGETSNARWEHSSGSADAV